MFQEDYLAVEKRGEIKKKNVQGKFVAYVECQAPYIGYFIGRFPIHSPFGFPLFLLSFYIYLCE